ncbi:HicB-like antitoxin [Gordonia phage Tarzan]|uniref:HicB-like antitoxin n=1 Tax=Gordonia phage Tarzan TaxID=3038367 RepID=A0AAF0K0A8_9CAUD|nr:HicB-like antitoxin [Gordonia phage Tarzan]WGH20095.1 HicB-like antitoxin [Gordonia phage Tarzan]
MNPMDITAQVRRSGDWWAIEVPEVPGLFTQARRLDQVVDTVRGAAADLGVDIDDIVVDIKIIDTNVDHEAIALVREHLAALERMQRQVANESRHLATQLREQGLSVRDAGYLMGVSPQRVSQLTATDEPTTRTKRVPVKVTTSRTTKRVSVPVRVKTTTTTTTAKTKADAIAKAKVKAERNPSGRKVYR